MCSCRCITKKKNLWRKELCPQTVKSHTHHARRTMDDQQPFRLPSMLCPHSSTVFQSDGTVTHLVLPCHWVWTRLVSHLEAPGRLEAAQSVPLAGHWIGMMASSCRWSGNRLSPGWEKKKCGLRLTNFMEWLWLGIAVECLLEIFHFKFNFNCIRATIKIKFVLGGILLQKRGG